MNVWCNGVGEAIPDRTHRSRKHGTIPDDEVDWVRGYLAPTMAEPPRLRFSLTRLLPFLLLVSVIQQAACFSFPDLRFGGVSNMRAASAGRWVAFSGGLRCVPLHISLPLVWASLVFFFWQPQSPCLAARHAPSCSACLFLTKLPSNFLISPRPAHRQYCARTSPTSPPPKLCAPHDDHSCVSLPLHCLN